MSHKIMSDADIREVRNRTVYVGAGGMRWHLTQAEASEVLDSHEALRAERDKLLADNERLRGKLDVAREERRFELLQKVVDSDAELRALREVEKAARAQHRMYPGSSIPDMREALAALDSLRSGKAGG